MGSTATASITTCLLHNPDRPVASSRDRQWSSITVDRHEGMKSFRMDAPALDHHSLVYVMQGAARLQQERDGKRHISTVCAGTVIVVAAGYPCLWRGASAASVRLRLLPDVVQRARQEIGSGGSSAEVLNIFNTRDDVIARFAQLLNYELEAPPHPSQRLIAEYASLALAAHLLRAYQDRSGTTKIPSKGLPPWALTRVLAYIDANNAGSITLEDLALEAGVSRFHFAHMFKLSTGQSPVAYVDRRRIEHAASLLRDRKLAPSLVATLLGFSSQAYFARRFVRWMNVSPARYVRECKR